MRSANPERCWPVSSAFGVSWAERAFVLGVGKKYAQIAQRVNLLIETARADDDGFQSTFDAASLRKIAVVTVPVVRQAT